MTDNSASNAGDVPTGYFPMKSRQDGPRRIGQYDLTRCIGRGGMGEVYEGFQRGLRRRVAIKILPEFRVANPGMMDRFRREVESIGRLNHPNIVQAYDAGEADQVPYLVMELVDGQDAEHLARKIGPLPVADACEIVRQAALGLQHAHEHHLVHRDIKPSNILISRQGAKIADLGMARLRSSESSLGALTNSGTVFGTPDYMAPEQADSARMLDIRADLYSLGCTLYRLLAGRPPFGLPEYDSIVKKMMAHATVPVPPLERHRPDLPAVLLEVIARLLAKQPDDRYRLPQDVALALEPFAAGHQLAALLERSLSGLHSNAASPPETPSSSVSAHKLETIDSPLQRVSLTVTQRTSTRAQTVTRVQTVALVICLAFCAYLLGGRGVGPQRLLPTAGEAPHSPAGGPTVPALADAPEASIASTTGSSAETPLAAPVAAGAANAPPGAGTRQPGVTSAERWVQAFGQAPRELIWPGHGGQGTWSLDENIKGLLISTTSPRLVQLGLLDGQSCTICMDIARKEGAGAVGLFFGYRETENDDIRNASLQLIEIRPVSEFNAPGYLLVRRQKAVLRSVTKSLSPVFELRARRTELPGIVPRLEITLRAGTIQLIRWANQDAPELVLPGQENLFEPGDLAGPWGIYSEGTTVWVTHPEMRME